MTTLKQQFILDEAKWLYERSHGTSQQSDALHNYVKARDAYAETIVDENSSHSTEELLKWKNFVKLVSFLPIEEWTQHTLYDLRDSATLPIRYGKK